MRSGSLIPGSANIAIRPGDLFNVIRGERGLNYGNYSYLEAFPEGGQRTMPPGERPATSPDLRSLDTHAAEPPSAFRVTGGRQGVT